jgi:acyl-CoA synthetase (AMP-forming)/AMP-acid ligase II/thioesterase domain-containing protein
MQVVSDPLRFDHFLQLVRWATETPDAPALLAPGRAPLTYAELWSHIQTTRRIMHDAGLCPGEAAALVMRGAELITAFLAISGGSACAPLNTSLTEDEHCFYLSSLGVRILLADEDLAAPAMAAAQHLGIRVLRVHTAPLSPAGVFTLESDGPLPEAPGRQTDAALLLFTSATTGNPKLIPLSCDNLVAVARLNSQALQLDQSDRFLAMVALFHSHGLGAVLTQLFCGGAVICTPAFDPNSFLQWLADFRPTWVSAGPPVLHAILALANSHPDFFRDLPLRFIQSAGAPAAPELTQSVEDAVHAPVLQAYGTTEVIGIARTTPAARKAGSVGRSIGTEIAITDESGAILPPDTEGEITVRGPTLTSGYLDDPEANRAAFRQGWFRTGDVGHLDCDGFLFITGRLKDIINRGGQKIILSEVDRALAKHPAVADAAAFPISHATLGEDVAAAVVLQPGASASESDLREFLAARLAAFKIPRRIIFSDALPRGAAGKLQRRALTEKFRDLADEPPRSSRPPDDTEKRLIDIWSRILSVPHIGIEDDFFRLGGESLTAAAMLTDVQRELNNGRALPARANFFAQPTIAVLARLLAAASLNGHSSPNHILSLQECGSRIPFFCFASDHLDPYYLRHLAKCLGDGQPFYVVCPPEPIYDNRLLRVEELASLLVTAIQTARPHGPYVLGGHCYGGVVAFEAAQQLLAQCHEVTQLVLFDVPTPGYPKVLRGWKRYLGESRRMLAAVARGEVRAQCAEAVRHVRRLAHVVRRRFGGRAIRAVGSVGTQMPTAPLNPKELTALALWEYVPRDFSAPIVHFLAADETVSTKVLDDPRLGWRDFAHGGLELRTSPGSHGSILDSQNSSALAVQLEPLLHKRSLASIEKSTPTRVRLGL